MNRHTRLLSSAMILLLTLAAFAGCVRVPNTAAAAAPAWLAAPASEKAEILQYLKAARSDLQLIDAVMSDEELGMTEDASEGEGGEMTEEDIRRYYELLDNYSYDIKDAIDAINARKTPNNADIAAFKAAELAVFRLTGELLDEYLQVLGYYELMMDVYGYIDEASKVQTDDFEAMYKAYNSAISKAIETLSTGQIPTCLKSMNDTMISALNDMNASVLYVINSYALEDPLRQDAALYRWEILLRKFDTISKGLEKDIEDRQAKLIADAKNVQSTNEGLAQWLDGNIDKLD